MYTSTFISLTAFALLESVLADSIPGLPDCARSCVTTSFANCNQLDVKCICSSPTLISGFSCCVFTNCNAGDQQLTLDFATNLCQSSGVNNLPQSASCPESSSTSASLSSSSSSSSTSAVMNSSIMPAIAGNSTALTGSISTTSVTVTTSSSSASSSSSSTASSSSATHTNSASLMTFMKRGSGQYEVVAALIGMGAVMVGVAAAL